MFSWAASLSFSLLLPPFRVQTFWSRSCKKKKALPGAGAYFLFFLWNFLSLPLWSIWSELTLWERLPDAQTAGEIILCFLLWSGFFLSPSSLQVSRGLLCPSLFLDCFPIFSAALQVYFWHDGEVNLINPRKQLIFLWRMASEEHGPSRRHVKPKHRAMFIPADVNKMDENISPGCLIQNNWCSPHQVVLSSGSERREMQWVGPEYRGWFWRLCRAEHRQSACSIYIAMHNPLLMSSILQHFDNLANKMGNKLLAASVWPTFAHLLLPSFCMSIWTPSWQQGGRSGITPEERAGPIVELVPGVLTRLSQRKGYKVFNPGYLSLSQYEEQTARVLQCVTQLQSHVWGSIRG